MEYKKKHGFVNAYYTLEAAFLIPFILIILVGLIYFTFFQYAECLMEQDNYMLCFRGSVMQNTKDGYGEILYGTIKERKESEVYQYLMSRKRYLSDKYPAYKSIKEEIIISNKTVKIVSQGKIPFPYADVWFSDNRKANLNVVKEIIIPDPIYRIRQEKRVE